MNDQGPSPREFNARNARQGRIILKSRGQRVIFAAGLAAIVVFAFLMIF